MYTYQRALRSTFHFTLSKLFLVSQCVDNSYYAEESLVINYAKLSKTSSSHIQLLVCLSTTFTCATCLLSILDGRNWKLALGSFRTNSNILLRHSLFLANACSLHTAISQLKNSKCFTSLFHIYIADVLDNLCLANIFVLCARFAQLRWGWNEINT